MCHYYTRMESILSLLLVLAAYIAVPTDRVPDLKNTAEKTNSELASSWLAKSTLLV